MNKYEFIDNYKAIFNASKGQIDEFVEIYGKLAPELKKIISDKLEELGALNTKRFDLSEKLKNLSYEEYEKLQAEQNSRMDKQDIDLKEILSAKFLGNDRDEADENRKMAIIDHKAFVFEVLTSDYPIGLDFLDGDINSIQREIWSLVPKF